MKCPAGKRLKRGRRVEKGWLYTAKRSDCRVCSLNRNCLPPSGKVRTVLIVDYYDALLRARCRKNNWDEATKEWYRRHRWRVEGVHGEAKTQHGLRRAARRGLSNVAIQVYLTAAAMNLKRLAALLLRISWQQRVVHAFQRSLNKQVIALADFYRYRNIDQFNLASTV